MRSWLLMFLLLSASLPAMAQESTDTSSTSSTSSGVRTEDEIPDDMPAAPEDAAPAEATAVGATADRPPHPKTPDPLAEPQPDAETLSKTMYHWLPGRWVWTGEQFEWKSGMWIYQVKDMILVPPRWEWSEQRKQWVFHEAGWAKPGTNVAVYRPTPAPGGPDVDQNAEQAPADSEQPKEQQQAEVTVYVWTGVYSPAVVVYPRWHPYYHYHWYHRHPSYRAVPFYNTSRYNYARAHYAKHGTYAKQQPAKPAGQPAQQPASKPPANATQAPPSSSARRTQSSYQESRKPKRSRPRR